MAVERRCFSAWTVIRDTPFLFFLRGGLSCACSSAECIELPRKFRRDAAGGSERACALCMTRLVLLVGLRHVPEFFLRFALLLLEVDGQAAEAVGKFAVLVRSAADDAGEASYNLVELRIEAVGLLVDRLGALFEACPFPAEVERRNAAEEAE